MKRRFFLILVAVFFVAGVLVGRLTVPREPELSTPPQNIASEIAQEVTVLRPSYMTSRELDSRVEGTPLYGLGKYFLQAEKKSGIGADVLLSIACHESNYGRNYWSGNARYNGRYYPCNQIFSWGVTGEGPHVYSFYYSKKDCIVGGINPITRKYQEGVPEKIYNLYLRPGAPYYSGQTLYAIGKHYAKDDRWYLGVERILDAIPKTEEERAKEWAVGSGVLRPLSVYKGIKEPKDYWTRPLTRRDLAMILWRINGK